MGSLAIRDRLGPRRRRHGGARALLAAVLSLAAIAGEADAAPGRTVWSAYMRAGPGAGYPVVDEVEHDTAIDLGACAGGWCRISYSGHAGYIDQDAITLARLPTRAAVGQKPAACLVAGQYSYRHLARTRFCAYGAGTGPQPGDAGPQSPRPAGPKPASGD